MEPRKEEKQEPRAPEVRKEEPKPKFQIVKLEERIAPLIIAYNHNETLVREPAKTEEKVPEVSKKESKLQIVKLEERIAPVYWTVNHNETLVRDRSA